MRLAVVSAPVDVTAPGAGTDPSSVAPGAGGLSCGWAGASVSRPGRSRQAGHRPWGASPGSLAPHLGQVASPTIDTLRRFGTRRSAILGRTGTKPRLDRLPAPHPFHHQEAGVRPGEGAGRSPQDPRMANSFPILSSTCPGSPTVAAIRSRSSFSVAPPQPLGGLLDRPPASASAATPAFHPELT